MKIRRMVFCLWMMTVAHDVMAQATIQAYPKTPQTTQSLVWTASYEAVLAGNKRSMTLAPRIQLFNESDTHWVDTSFELVRDDGVSSTFSIPWKLSIPARHSVFAALPMETRVPVDFEYVYEGVKFDRFPRNPQADLDYGILYTTEITSRLSFSAATSLPPGGFHVNAIRNGNDMERVGFAFLPQTEARRRVTLNLGTATGLSGERSRTSHSDIRNPVSFEESFSIRIFNRTDSAKRVQVRERLYRGDQWNILRADTSYRRDEDGRGIVFELNIKPQSSQSCSYTAAYTWPTSDADAADGGNTAE